MHNKYICIYRYTPTANHNNVDNSSKTRVLLMSNGTNTTTTTNTTGNQTNTHLNT